MLVLNLPQLGAQVNLLKQQLKHSFRDEMVQIGIRAIEHALRLVSPDSKTYRTVTEYIQLIRDKKLPEIAQLVREHQRIENDVRNRIIPDRPYTIETCFTEAAESLLKLSISEKWISGGMMLSVFVPCWNGASRISDHEQRQEEEFQNSVLYPEIEAKFERLREDEKQLKAA